MPELIAASYLTRYSLKMIHLLDDWADRQFYVCTQPREELRQQVVEFLDYLRTP
jgi:hypothetical protein